MELFLYSLLKNKGVSVKLSGTSHLVLDCFYCGREGKLYYNFNKHIGDCKVCQVYVTLLDIEKQYKISNYKKAPSLKNIKNKLKTIDQSSLESDLLEVQLPEECEPVKYHKLAKNFLWQRGIADTDSLLFCHENEA